MSFKEIFSKTLFNKNFSLRKDDGHYIFRILDLDTGIRDFFFQTGIFFPKFIYNTCGYEEPNHNMSFSPGYGYISITFPWKNKLEKYRFGNDLDDEAYRLGFDMMNDSGMETKLPTSYILYKGKGCGKIKDFPWRYDFLFGQTLDKNQNWENTNTIKENDMFVFKTHFIYFTKTGIRQETTADVRVIRNLYRPKIFMKSNIKLFDKSVYRLDIEFDKPVGENVDDWKGGTYAVSIPVSDNESKLLNGCCDFNVVLPKILVKKFDEIRRENSL